MSCFWEGIIKTLNENEKSKLSLANGASKIELVKCLKRKSYHLTDANVLWQGEKLKKQLCNELKMWVDNYNEQNINNGHDTSSCDPFLVLLCELLDWNITFMYTGSKISFENGNSGKKRLVKFGANTHHFFKM